MREGCAKGAYRLLIVKNVSKKKAKGSGSKWTQQSQAMRCRCNEVGSLKNLAVFICPETE